LYESGDGVPPDPARAFALFLAAARQGSSDGERAVGMAYRYGVGTQKDANAAMTWLLRAAAQNDAAAEFYISKAYAAGEGVPPDRQKHLEWQKRAADHGDGFAQLVRGLELSENPSPSVDFAESARLLTAALAQTDLLLLRSRAKPDPTRVGLALARLTLGMQYAGGLGVPKDDAKARELMVQAIPDLANRPLHDRGRVPFYIFSGGCGQS
jgi:TPR repeat protein